MVLCIFDSAMFHKTLGQQLIESVPRMSLKLLMPELTSIQIFVRNQRKWLCARTENAINFSFLCSRLIQEIHCLQ